jgi:hypothetical protein
LLCTALAALVACLPIGAREVRANMGARSFFTPAKGSGALTAAGTPQIRVQEVSLSLDLREVGRGPSTAEYLLVNLDPAQAWEDELIFVSSAPTITVTEDGTPRSVKPRERDQESTRAWGLDDHGNGFRIRLAPGQTSRIVVAFTCEPGTQQTKLSEEYGRDGLTRLSAFGNASFLASASHFTYPLWPAYGFAGGVGEMSIAVLTGQGVEPLEGTTSTAWTSQPLARGETRWTIRLPATSSHEQVPLREVTVRYPSRRPSRWKLGASAFAAIHFAGRNERLVSPHLAVSADIIAAGLGALMLGAETAFARSASLSLAFQHGVAVSFVSAYVGGAILASFSPQATPGFELRVGTRLVWLPLDLAFQAHPWVTPGEGRVARYRVLAGVRVGVW